MKASFDTETKKLICLFPHEEAYINKGEYLRELSDEETLLLDNGGPFEDSDNGLIKSLNITLFKKQNTRVVLKRLTNEEKILLRSSIDPNVRDAYDSALSEGIISEADPDFELFRILLDSLNIIKDNRWDELLAN